MTLSQTPGAIRFREWFDKPGNREKNYARNRNRQHLRSGAIYWYKLTHPCACGETDPWALDFDHVESRDGLTVSQMMGRCKPLQEILAEIQKCVVMCANCHRRKTGETTGWRRYDYVQL